MPDPTTTCIIIISSVFGSLCLIGTISCCFYNFNYRYPNHTVVAPIPEFVTITKEHYNSLKQLHGELPKYTPEEGDPPEYI